MAEFKRGIRKKGMIKALADLATRSGWWRDVLHDKSLIIGVRDDYLNIYWRGQSIFKVEMKHERIVATTHPKYLLDPDLSGQVALDTETGAFVLDGLDALTRIYVPGETLPKLKRAAGLFAGDEKAGIQAIVNANPNVVDVEIAFPAEPGSRSAPRIDIATFNETEAGVKLVFWEAKVLGNPELRISGEKNVVRQIELYRTRLAQTPENVVETYETVARNLVDIAKMSGDARKVPEAVRKVAQGTPLTLSSSPDVRLIVYGFDKDQRDGAWKKLLTDNASQLKGIEILARGNPGDIRL
ncbi:hypothetical protein V5F29_05360 [Xanthobacter aminoxidans]|uniref:hypothetical protein n=1 Tax=Xanthobacter aminoxidans TaxID=186280 RepID=UPI00372B7F77